MRRRGRLWENKLKRMSEQAQVTDTEENVVIETGGCVVTLLPQFGGKIASIQVHGRELLQQPLAPIALRTREMSFDAGDASGWDECLPSVAACDVEFDGGTAEIPDHGDLWRVGWEPNGTKGLNHPMRQKSSHGNPDGDQGAQAISLSAKCFSLPLELERTVLLEEIDGGWRLGLEYRVTNFGSAPAPWSWAAHPLFLAEEGDRIVLPESIRTLRVEGSGGGRLGKSGDTVSWPMTRLTDGSKADLRVALGGDSGVGDKLFTSALNAEENWCELIRPNAGVRIRVGFDAAATPYLGLWICYGGWPEKDGPKQTCVAMEPATAPVDSLAVLGPWSRLLQPGESYLWPMRIDIRAI
jgi:galactose mutarotase-like enzyme